MAINCTDLVSIIVPAYNAEKYIGEAIESVLRQTYPYFEVIIVDDGSKDRTVEIVKSFKDKRIHLIQHSKNKGVSAARNIAMKHAEGKWFALLDADDQWLPERLEKLMEILFESGDDYFIADDTILCFNTPNGLKIWISYFKRIGVSLSKEISELSLLDYLKLSYDMTTMMQPIFPAKPVKIFDLEFNTSLQIGEDLEFLCNLFRVGLKLKLYKQGFYLCRLTPNSITRGSAGMLGGVNAFKLLSENEGFTAEERHLFKLGLKRAKKGVPYRNFAYMLKTKKIFKAVILLFKHPYLFIKLLYALPRFLKYRFAAMRVRDRVK